MLPELPGVAIASRYVAGGPEVEVGGDWYDVLALADGQLALAMGDVVGRGVPAASFDGPAPQRLAGLHGRGPRPREALSLLNRMLRDIGAPHHMATLVVMLLDPETGDLRYANAGHPPPLVATADGMTLFLEDAVSVPLGAVGNAEYSEASVTMAQRFHFGPLHRWPGRGPPMPFDIGLEQAVLLCTNAQECTDMIRHT